MVEQADLLQVRHRDPPAALQVEVDPQVHHVAQGGVGAPAQRRVLAGLQRVLAAVQAERAGDRGGDVVVEQAFLAVGSPLLDAARYSAPRTMVTCDEVVEVTGLQRGVLPVVDEGEQLARRRVQGASAARPAGSRTIDIEISDVADDRPSWSRVASLAKSWPRTCS